MESFMFCLAENGHILFSRLNLLSKRNELVLNRRHETNTTFQTTITSH